VSRDKTAPGKPSKSKPASGKPPPSRPQSGKPAGGKAAAPKTPGGHSSGKKLSAKAKDPRFAERVHTAHKRSLSSIIWLQRQLNDPYVMRAKEEGWRSRAAFKLIEIDEKHRMLKHGQIIVDLGAAPGGWSQYAAKKVGSVSGKAGKVVGIDLLPIEPIAGVMLAEMDFTEEDAPRQLLAMLDAEPGQRVVDGVLSDMAANTTGHRKTDHLRIVGLTEMAVAFTIEVLKPGGFFVTKLFQGGETAAMITLLKQHFSVVKHVKPQSSRADSAELYVLATGFKG
jgi:23S rRNA (uridine2552-2'-O)-methyltransferase